jgi:nucleotide-binding universal stress UspA family protein
MYKRAVVPLDGSMVAETIIPFILGIAGPLDLEVVLLRVVSPTSSWKASDSSRGAAEDFETRRTDAEEYLAALTAELRAQGLRFQTVVRAGDAAGEIVAAARVADADLIAMTTHGRSGLSRVLFGSVAEAVLRQATIPVFMLRQTEAEVTRRAVQRKYGP